MQRKATENLRAAITLLAMREPATNAATARAYYAAYHAAWAGMITEGHPVPRSDGRRYFRHAALPHEALQAGLLDFDLEEDLVHLRETRVVADYAEDFITHAQARACVKLAGEIVSRLLDFPEGEP